MITDVQNTLFGPNTAFNTGGQATYDEGFSYDLWGGQSALPTDAIGNTVGIDPGLGKLVKVVIDVTTTVTGTSVVIQFVVTAADNAAMTTNVTNLVLSRAWPVASLVAGFQERLVIPPNTLKRFLGFRYIVTGGTVTAGKGSVWVVQGESTSYPQT